MVRDRRPSKATPSPLKERPILNELAMDFHQEAANRFASCDVLEIVISLMTLALSNHNVIHIFIRYSSQINCLDVSVYPIDTQFFEKEHRLLTSDIFLNHNNARRDLLILEDVLIDLIAGVRDQHQEAE